MNQFNQGFSGFSPITAAKDEALRSYMQKVYAMMSAAVGFTGLFAWVLSSNPSTAMLSYAFGSYTPFIWMGVLILLGMFSQKLLMNYSRSVAYVAFTAYAAVWAIMLSALFYMIRMQGQEIIIVQAFLGTAAGFLAMSVWGYTTKKDLSPFATFGVVFFVGFIALALLNALIFKSSLLSMGMAAAAVGVMALMTAIETQQIKNIYYSGAKGEQLNRYAIFGAFMLYGSFISMFYNLLFLLYSFTNNE